jgi:DNA polymerase III subunit alpha
LQEKSDKLQKKDTRNLYQMDIFGTEYGAVDTIEIPDMEELPREELLRSEKEALGFYFSRHPLEAYEELIGRVTPFDTQKLKETDTFEDVTIVGMINNLREVVTKRGDKMAYITLEDMKGIVEVIVFPDLYSKNQRNIASEKPLIVTGTLEKVDESGARMKAKNITLLEEIAREMKKKVRVRIDCQVFVKEDLRKLKDILMSLRGRASVCLEFVMNGDRESLEIKDLGVDPAKMDVLLKNFPDGISFEVVDETLP